MDAQLYQNSRLMQSLNKIGTVLTLLNSMIGSTTLVLPIVFIQSGLLTASFIVVLVGAFSSYACKLFLEHLSAQQSDIPQSLKRHFSQSRLSFVKKLYQLVCLMNLLLTCYIYFFLINLQWRSLLDLDYSSELGKRERSYILYSCSAVLLLIMLFLSDRYQISLKMACYGVISVLTYFGIIVWLFSTNKAQRISFPLVTSNMGQISGCMSMVFSIQSIFVPIIKRNQNLEDGKSCLWISFLLGGIVYLILGLCGAIGIAGRAVNYNTQRSILDFFNRGEDFPYFIQVAYLCHLYSVYPYYVQICLTRLWDALGLSPTQLQKYVAICTIMGSSFALQCLQTRLSHLMAFNGALSCFFFAYFVPGLVHFKCKYFNNKNQQVYAQNPEHQPVESREELQRKIQCSGESVQGSRGRWARALQLSWLGVMSVLSSSLLVYSIVVLCLGNF